MPEQATVSLASASRSGARSSFTELSPDIQTALYRRLGGAALLYSGAWITTFTYFKLTKHAMGEPDRELFWNVMTAVCALLGLAVYFVSRSRRIPARWFWNVATAFEIAGALGIMAGWLGWESHGVEMLRRVGAALGADTRDLTANVLQPLIENHVRILYHEGLTWVCAWLVTFPLVVPLSMTRTIVATLCTASTVPAVLLLSVAINGAPESIRPWIIPYVLEVSVPTYICAGLAIFSSRVVYKLTRELSEARRLGSYQLVERIGAGGMGEVWKAKHRLLARPAAIKLIRPEVLGEGETALRRFEREAQATSGLSSAHSIELYDFGVTDEGTFYYVMELLQGIDLKTLVERYGPVSAERTIHILKQACHSLHDAHLTGVVHRDIKPGNLFVCRKGPEYDFVKVLDFGLVKQVGDVEPKGAQLTVEGVASGTPAFMAPEMIMDNRHVDGRVDLYALGCVGYWLVTGQLVFDEASPMATLLRHAKDAPPLPSSRTELDIPDGLERIIMACLEKDPGARPQSARALSDLLSACECSTAGWNEDRAREWWVTHLPDLAHAAPAKTT